MAPPPQLVKCLACQECQECQEMTLLPRGAPPPMNPSPPQNVPSTPVTTTLRTEPDSPRRQLTPMWLDDLNAAAQKQFAWLWQGYLAPGNVTLLTSQWKSGKTTLVSILLARLKEG